MLLKINWTEARALNVASMACAAIVASATKINQETIFITTEQKMIGIGVPLGMCAITLGIGFVIDYLILGRKILK
jgi:hypothetical protein